MLPHAAFSPKWWNAERGPAPVFHLRFGTVMERELLDAELAGKYRAGHVHPFLLTEALKGAVRAMGGADTDALIALIEQAEAAMTGAGEPLSDADAATFGKVQQIAAEHWPQYQELVAQRERRDHLLPVVAFQKFCVGWDNVLGTDGEPVAFAADPFTGVSDAALRRVPPLLVRSAGFQAYRLQFPQAELDDEDSDPVTAENVADQSAEKNSAPPSPSRAEAAPSTQVSPAMTSVEAG